MNHARTVTTAVTVSEATVMVCCLLLLKYAHLPIQFEFIIPQLPYQHPLICVKLPCFASKTLCPMLIVVCLKLLCYTGTWNRISSFIMKSQHFAAAIK
jgi:hypothetical protein